MNENDITALLTLKNIRGVGNILIKRLVEKFGSPEKIFSSTVSELKTVDGMTQNKIYDIKNTNSPDFIKEELKIAADEGIKIIPLSSRRYPVLLQEIADPPPVLYMKGNLPEDIVSIAVVGSRKAAREGMAAAAQLGRKLSESGIRVTSGLALGIDGAAHSGAIGYPGSTTAVLGSGLLKIYPREHRYLFKKISREGAVVSEFPLMTPPDRYNFPARNRIISGLSLGVVVVEAAERSGAIITAKSAADQGKDVFVFNLHGKNSAGVNNLIELGAKEISGIKEILFEYPWLNKKASITHNNKKELDFNEELVVKALKHAEFPLHIDEINKACKELEIKEITVILIAMELKGILGKLPGQYYYLLSEGKN